VTAPAVFVSPHLDDAVLGCGQLIGARPGAVVATLFAGSPPPSQPPTEWDARSGFAPGDDVLGARRAEDARALAALGARPRWLPYRDAQYGGGAAPPLLAAAIEAVLAEFPAADVFAPLGLFHSDHVRAREAALLAARRSPEHTWTFYADGLYATLPRAVEEATAAIASRGVALAPWSPPAAAPLERKRRAIACYRSQLCALASPGRIDASAALAPERYWRVVR